MARPRSCTSARVIVTNAVSARDSAAAWSHDRSAGQVALGTTLSVGVNALMNVVKELAPAWHVRIPLVHREVVLPFGQ